MKRRIIAALMALCLCIGLLPATALAADASAENEYVKFEYESTQLQGLFGTVTVIVQNAEGDSLGDPIVVYDYYKTGSIENTITVIDSGYQLKSVEQSKGTKVDHSITSTEAKFTWTFIGDDATLYVTLAERDEGLLEGGEVDHAGIVYFNVTDYELLKMLYGANVEVSADTEITNVTLRYEETNQLLDTEDFVSLAGYIETDYVDYWQADASNGSFLATPYNVSQLEIEYNDGSIAVIPNADLHYTRDGDTYWIESRAETPYIVAFYNENNAATENNYSLYAIRFIDQSGETVAENGGMPQNPEYDSTDYVFASWTVGYDGGQPFLSTTPVTGDTVVYAQKVYQSSKQTEIHVMNNDDLFVERLEELFGTDQIDMESVKITVNGSGGEQTNPDYTTGGGTELEQNRWVEWDDSEYGYYLVYNYLPGAEGTGQGNTAIHINEITSIDVTATVTIDGEKTAKTVRIQRGNYDGDFEVSTGSTATISHIIELYINSDNYPENPDTPDPDPGDDYAITGINKTLVDSGEEKDAAQNAGIVVDSYTYPNDEGTVIIPEDGTVTLLYAITVTGKEGAAFTVTDTGADLVAGAEIAEDPADTFTGSIPAGATSITFYVSKTFDADDLENASEGDGTVLKNTANVAGENAGDADPDEDEDTEETPAEEEDPTKPDFDDDVLAGVTVQVLCVQNPTGHTYKTTLKDAPSTAYKTSIESYEGSFGDWKCTVSIDTDVFVGLFNSKAAEASWGTHAFSYATPDELVFYYTEASGWLCASDPTFTISVTEQKSQYTLTYDANGGVFFPPDELVERTTNSVTLAPGEYTLDKVAGYLEPVPYFNGQGEKVLFAGWTMKEPEEKGKVYHYNDSDIPEIEETVTITDQPVTVYAVWSYDENDDEEADINQIVVKPADITIYMGGTGYEGTVDASGNIITSTDGAGLPEPGFIVTLPASAPANTVITDLVFEEADGGDRTWQFETYDGQADTVVYKLVPQGDEQTATRVRFTKADGTVIVSDEFTVGLEVNTSFTMALYKGSGATAVGKIVADIGGKSYSVNSDPTGTLTVRGTTDGAQYAGMTPEETRSLPEEGKPAVMAPVGTTYAINGGDVQVQDSSGVALLFDAIIDHADEDRTELLQKRAEAYFTDKDVEPETGNKFAYEFKYLDLVDQNNGNVWVKASNDATIYWPLPEGADTNTLKVLHFKDLHREMATADIESQIEQCDVEAIDVEVVGSHVTFKIGSSGFSPFALVWQEKDGTTPAQYTVTYHENFGSSTDTRQNDFAAGTQVTVITNPFGGHSNYAFDGWNTRADGNGTSYDPGDPLTVTGNITLYAQWRYTGGGEYNPKDATLRFNSRGGTEFDDIVRDDPFEYNPYNKIPTRPGYRFTGWYDSSRLDDRYDEDEEISVPMGITTVWAGWEETSVPSMLNGDDHYAYIQGYSDGTVRPNANITRAQARWPPSSSACWTRTCGTTT